MAETGENNLLQEVKTRLAITGNFHDELLSAYISDVKDYVKSAGADPESAGSVGVIARGVADLWNFGAGEGKFSEIFYQRVIQLSVEHETPVEPVEPDDNLLNKPFVFLTESEVTEKGITFTNGEENLLHIAGRNTEGFYVLLKELTLGVGTYYLTGMDGTGVKNVGVALQVRKSNGEDFTTAIRCYDGHPETIVIEEETAVVIRLWFGANGYNVDCDINPSLVRTE